MSQYEREIRRQQEEEEELRLGGVIELPEKTLRKMSQAQKQRWYSLRTNEEKINFLQDLNARNEERKRADRERKARERELEREQRRPVFRRVTTQPIARAVAEAAPGLAQREEIEIISRAPQMEPYYRYRTAPEFQRIPRETYAIPEAFTVGEPYTGSMTYASRIKSYTPPTKSEFNKMEKRAQELGETITEENFAEYSLAVKDPRYLRLRALPESLPNKDKLIQEYLDERYRKYREYMRNPETYLAGKSRLSTLERREQARLAYQTRFNYVSTAKDPYAARAFQRLEESKEKAKDKEIRKFGAGDEGKENRKKHALAVKEVNRVLKDYALQQSQAFGVPPVVSGTIHATIKPDGAVKIRNEPFPDITRIHPVTGARLSWNGFVRQQWIIRRNNVKTEGPIKAGEAPSITKLASENWARARDSTEVSERLREKEKRRQAREEARAQDPEKQRRYDAAQEKRKKDAQERAARMNELKLRALEGKPQDLYDANYARRMGALMELRKRQQMSKKRTRVAFPHGLTRGEYAKAYFPERKIAGYSINPATGKYYKSSDVEVMYSPESPEVKYGFGMTRAEFLSGQEASGLSYSPVEYRRASGLY